MSLQDSKLILAGKSREVKSSYKEEI